MNLYIRVFLLFVRALFKPRLSDVLSLSTLRFYVLPNDLDFNGHMNNGRYLTIMDLGRLDLILRTGLMRMMLKQKSVPVLGSAKIRYRLPLMPFEPFDLHTRIVGWDEKWMYIEQRFIKAKGDKAGQVAAIAVLKGSFFNQKTKSTIPTQDVLKMIGSGQISPQLPEHIIAWQLAESSLREVTK